MKKQSFVKTKTSPKTLPIQKKKKRVGLLGGGFNPVHMGHLIMADQVFDQLCLDECYLMPTFQSPHVDEKRVIEASDRVEMLKLAVETHEHLGIELTEINREGKSYTYDTISYLKEIHPDVDYYFIIGADMVEYLPKWYNIDELVDMVQFVAVKRNGYTEKSPYPLIWVDAPLIDISSSMIRKKISKNSSIKYLLPDNVVDYIHKKGLYGYE